MDTTFFDGEGMNNQNDMVPYNNVNSPMNFNEEQLNMNEIFIKNMMDSMAMLSQHNKYISEVHKDVKKLRQEVGEAKDIAVVAAEKAEKVLNEINNHVFLTDGEANEIYKTICNKSTSIAFDLDEVYFPSEKDISKVTGKVRRGLWSMLRKKFGVSSYRKIKHIDYEKALNIAKSFSIEKYENYLKTYRNYKQM